jgi:hypothetical protein
VTRRRLADRSRSSGPPGEAPVVASTSTDAKDEPTPAGIPLTGPLSALKIREQETLLRRAGNRFMFPVLTLSSIDAPKADPRDVAVAALDGIEAAAHEVLADETARWMKRPSAIRRRWHPCRSNPC